jgi:glycosyltransferase involved in cell wall biosynthesis
VLFSVVIAVYNNAATLQGCIESVLAQTVADLEVLIVDDGSQDGTATWSECSEIFRDPRLRYIRQDHGGVSMARNRGIIEARGEYIAFLDGDDRWLPGKLEAFLPQIEANAEFIYSDAFWDGGRGQSRLYSERSQPYQGWVQGRLFRANFVCTSTVVVRKELLMRLGLFNCLLRACEDYLMWLKLAKYVEFSYLPVPLTVYRFSPGGLSQTHVLGNYFRLLAIRMMLLDSYREGLWPLLAKVVRCSLKLPVIVLRSWWSRYSAVRDRADADAGLGAGTVGSSSSRSALGPFEAGSRVSPRVSVIMSVYNERNYVRHAVDSILAQTWSDFEFLIIDDGSTDDTAGVICEYTDRRIRLVRQTNQGLERSLNRAILLAQGAYLARMDADDVCRPDRLALQVSFLDQRPSCGLVGSCCTVQWDGDSVPKHTRVPNTDRAIRKRIFRENPFVHSSVMVRRSILDQIGLYKPEYRWGDYELWCRVLQVCEVANLPDELVARTIRRDGSYRVLKSLHYKENLRVQFSMLGPKTPPARVCLGLLWNGLAWAIHRCLEGLSEASRA